MERAVWTAQWSAAAGGAVPRRFKQTKRMTTLLESSRAADLRPVQERAQLALAAALELQSTDVGGQERNEGSTVT
jgi:hypothetical protein